GEVAGVSAEHVDALGLSLSNLSGINDETIRSAENVLLAFTNVRNEFGKGNKVFDRATKAILDYSVRTGRDASSAAVIFGRALQDPASKLAGLSRAGVVFTKTQIDMVRHVEKTKGILAAQKVVLTELERRYGGAAKAAGETLPGKLAILRERFRDLAGQLVGS